MSSTETYGRDAGTHRGRTALRLLRRTAFGVLGIALIVAAWWALSRTTVPVRIPSPGLVWERLINNLTEIEALSFVAFGSGGILDNLAYTATNVLIGVAVGTAGGLVVGILIGRVRVVRELLEAPLLFLGTVPVLVLLPFLSLWFGTARIATNGLVIFYTFVTVSLGAQQATLNVSGYFEQYAASLGAGQTQVMRHVVAPAIAPEVIGSVRVALAYGWGFQAIAEVLGGQVGVGRILRVFSQSSGTPEMFGVVIATAILAVIVDAAVTAGGRWITRWQE